MAPWFSLHGSTPSISLRRSRHEEHGSHDRRAPSSSTRTATLHRQSSEPGHGYGLCRRGAELVADNDDDHDDSNHHPHGKNLTHMSAWGSMYVIVIGLVTTSLVVFWEEEEESQSIVPPPKVQ
jgi:hypothetical protein